MNTEDLVRQFEQSRNLDYDKWREGASYDLEAIDAAAPAQRHRIEELLLAHGISGWRDVEALARLNSPRAQEALVAALDTGNAEVRLAVKRFAPQLVSPDRRLDSLLRALETAEFYHGLSQALDEVQDFHPPEVIAALLRGARHRDGEVACHFAAMLFYLHQLASEPFDWAHRPFFLRFNTEVRAEREAAFTELCTRLGVDPRAY